MKTLLLALATPLTLALAPALTPAPLVQDVQKPLDELYADHFTAQDATAMAKAWAANEPRVLGTIDADLEASLAIWEQAMSRDEPGLTADETAEIAMRHQRALFGARAATEDFDRPIFLDYTSAFVSWNAEQKEAFRAGQAAFRNAIGGLGKEDWQAARAAATECVALAQPLGDWWGTAMGLGVIGAAEAQLGNHDAALSALGQSRLLNASLGLRGAERRDLQTMLAVLQETGQTHRALAVLDDLLNDARGEEQKLLEEQRLVLIHAGL